MVTDLYVGLAALQAALLAIYVAAVLVMVQMAGQSFSVATPYLLLRRPRFLAAAAFSSVVALFALAGAVRAAFPNADALPGNQGTGVLIEDIWPAIGASAALILALAWNAAVLVSIASTLRGPGLARALARDLRLDTWTDWIDFLHSDEGASERRLRERYEGGKLNDPLAPLSEMATVAIETRRYSLVEPVLAEIWKKLDAWLTLPEGRRPDSYRTITTVLHHLNDVVDAAQAAQAVTPIEAAIRNLVSAANSAISREDRPMAIRIADELASWAGRLAPTTQRSAAITAIRAVREIARTADERGDLAIFEQCALALGSAAEEIAASRRTRPQRLLRAGYTDARHESVEASLINEFSNLTSSFIRYEGGIRGSVQNARFMLDGLLVAARAFLTTPQPDAYSDEAAASFIRCMGRIGLAAAKAELTDVSGMVTYGLANLGQAGAQAWGRQWREALAHAAFEMGLYAEAAAEARERDGSPLGLASERDGLPARLAGVCSLAGADAVEGAVRGSFLRGDTGHTAAETQKSFLRRVEALMGRRFRGSYGDTSEPTTTIC